jgi:chorismate lyase/3-hydroxybenzoate synthase
MEPSRRSDPPGPSPLRFELVAAAGTPLAAAAARENVLLAVGYGAPGGDWGRSASPWLAVPNRVLGGGASVELWRSPRPVRWFRRGTLAWAEDGDLLAGCLLRPASGDVEAATRDHFAELLELLAARGYPHLLRVWNYLPAINAGEGDEETYRRFNAGRARAFAERFGEEGAPRRYPAASTVGTPGVDLRTAFLACVAPPERVENPRQVRAYRYPPRYGRVAPSFSRATVAPPGLAGALFLSGTASIAGHETRFAGSVEDQLAETLVNLEAVIEAARPASPRPPAPLAGLDLVKVYLRHAGDAARVRAALARALDPATPVVLLEADICRRDLLIEIDGFALRGGRTAADSRDES